MEQKVIGLQHIVVQTDSKLLVDAISDLIDIPWQ